MILFKLTVILIVIKAIQCANILFISPTASYSHVCTVMYVVYFPIIRELSLRGHKVVTIIPDLLNDPKLVNLTEIDIHDVSYKFVKTKLENLVKLLLTDDRVMNQIKWLDDYSYTFLDILLQQPSVQDLITHPEDYHFDLVITEWLSFQSTVAFADLFKCPLIGISSYTLYLSGYDVIGSPTHSTYLPNAWDRFVEPTSFWDRFTSFLNAIEYRYYYKNYMLPKQEFLVRKYFKNASRSLLEMEKHVSLVLTNTNPILHGSYPKVGNLIQFGGIHEQQFIPLPKELQSFLDRAKNGFIYFSLGSNIKSFLLGDETISKITKVFKNLSYKILWKFEGDTLPIKPDNVFISKWVPQRAVLEHKNIKLFITQGGLQSAEEAIRAQVPFIIIPFFADQNQNAGRLEQLGVGKRLLRTELKEENLENTIYEVINNDRYKQRVIELSETLWDQETKPLDRVIWWIEYVIRHKGAKYLLNPALDPPWYEVQLLDVYLLIIALLFSSILIIYSTVRKLYYYLKHKLSMPYKKIKIN